MEEKINITEYIIECSDEELKNLLLYIVKWNTHSKNTVICSKLLKIIFTSFESNKILELINKENIFDPLLSYFERHINVYLYNILLEN